jgi:hypothetical protein
MEYCHDFMFSIIKNPLIIDIFKMANVAFVFVCDAVMDESTFIL